MPRMPRGDVAHLRVELWEHTQGRCEWPRCPMLAQEMAHRKGKGSGGRATYYTLTDVFALCIFHHRCQDGEAGEVISGRSRKAEILHLYESTDPVTFSGDRLLILDSYVNDRGGQRARQGLKDAITEALAVHAFAGRVPATVDK